jgi:hypothetical protein
MVVTNYLMSLGLWTHTGPSERYLHYYELCEGCVLIVIRARVSLAEKSMGKTLTWTRTHAWSSK